jgi:uncharacterized protein (DUF1810 family)
MTADDPFDLARFVTAQTGAFEAAMEELRAGRKQTHWMWFIFPQMRGLGRSPTAVFYGVASRAEAKAYLRHPVLGPRLDAATRAALGHAAQGAHALFGSPDDLKFRSSMTLFSQLQPGGPFAQALAAFFSGEADEATLRLIAAPRG